MLRLPLASLLLALAACAPQTDFSEEIDESTIADMKADLVPRVERAVGLDFRSDPGIAIRSADEVRRFLLERLASTVPADDLEGFQISLKLFGLFPDSLDLGDLLVQLYTEQVVGYYDPDSTTLYVVDHVDPLQLRLVLAHELVHALQDQYTDVDSLLSISRETDRAAAAQAVLEGQATLASLLAIRPGQDISELPALWDQARDLVRDGQESMPVFSSAPLILRESALFPYLDGADFMTWFAQNYPGVEPFDSLMPASTEQIMHPERYRDRDEPTDLRFVDEELARYADGFGEFSIKVLLQELSGREAVGLAAASDWDGDRYALYEADGDHALVWWTVWDNEAQARRFATILDREWGGRNTGRRYVVRVDSVESRPAVVLADGPDSWVGWSDLPRVVPFDLN